MCWQTPTAVPYNRRHLDLRHSPSLGEHMRCFLGTLALVVRRVMPKYSFRLLPLVLLTPAVASAQEPAVPGIRTRQKLTILSANDGYVHRRPNPDPMDKQAVTQDSITVIHL